VRLLKHILAITALLSLAACIALGPVDSYTAADGSSQATYTDGWCSTPLSSTVILERPDVLVQLDIYGVQRGAYTFDGQRDLLWADIVVAPQPGTVARVLDMLDSSVEVVSPDFTKPQSAAAGQSEFRGRVTYHYTIPMPSIPNEITMRFPKLKVNGQVVKLPSLALRGERRLEFAYLVCQ
jgi:hypothetical protein